MATLYFIVIYVICAVYMVLNFKYDIQMFQQNSYRLDRYWRWLKPNIGSSWRLVDLACLFLLMAPRLLDFRMSVFVVALVCLSKIFMILHRKYKKPLVFTRRVWRLYILTALLSVGGGVAIAICSWGKAVGIYSGATVTVGYMMLASLFSWAIVIVSSLILIPVEKAIQQRYINDAKRILASMPELRIIGITGSYGKTSTKHYLKRILDEEYDVLMTPGSYNTPMGVVRTIREYLKPYNQIFICEMGAKQRGDIEEICNIVHPEMGIVTAVGPMHLESFKTLDNVRDTKFELVDALPADGCAVVNNDFSPIAGRRIDNVRALRYGVTHPEGCDYVATNVCYGPTGTTFTVEGPDGFRLDLETRLLGECNVSDLLAAVVIALQLKVPAEKIRYAVASIDQVEHRLSIKQTPGGVTIIDDAFNSNPSGSRMAVDVLSHFTDGKRIIVTPGMIELGSEQDNLNRAFGRHIGKNVDIAIIVGEYNRESITAGIKETEFDTTNLYIVDNFNMAQAELGKLLAKGDTVLYENDLPDTFK